MNRRPIVGCNCNVIGPIFANFAELAKIISLLVIFYLKNINWATERTLLLTNNINVSNKTSSYGNSESK